MAIILLTLPLMHGLHVDRDAALVAVVAMGAGGASTIAPWLDPWSKRLGYPVAAIGLLVLVEATGGIESPYRAFYVVLLLAAAIAYQGRSFVLVCGLVVLLAATPYVTHSASDIAAERTDLVVTLSVWLFVAATAHALVRDRRTYGRQLQDQEQRYRSLFELNPDAVFSLDRNGRILTANAAGASLLGCAAEQLCERDFGGFFRTEDRSELARRLRAVFDRHPQTFETTVLGCHGSPIPVALTCLPTVVDGVVTSVYCILKDISDLIALQVRLAQQALSDPLTGLANRTLLTDRLELALSGAERSGEPVCVLLLDLDGFKKVNDELGHAAGDAVLVEATSRLRRCIRPGDTLARLGGDEFVVVLPGTSLPEGIAVSDRILEELARPADAGGRHVSVGGSIGLAVEAGPGAVAEDVLARADLAMYAAKRGGRGRHAVYRLGMELAGAPRSAEVSAAGAHAWKTYMHALRREIAQRKDDGRLPAGMRAPASAHRTLQQLLAAISELPADRGVVSLELPESGNLQEFVFHQTAVHHWADALVEEGVLRTVRSPQADHFWAALNSTVATESVLVADS